jgi:small GTP-binding protein
MVILGDSSVGKTSLLTRYIEDTWSESCLPTVGIDYQNKYVTHQDIRYRVDIWDTAGQEKYQAVTPFSVRGACGALIVFDVTSEESFKSIATTWLSVLREHNGDSSCFVVVFGNKIDLDRTVTLSGASEFCEESEIEYFEGSAKTGEGVNEAFDRMIKGALPKTVFTGPVPQTKRTQCCRS